MNLAKNENNFEKLLYWLDADSDEAAEKYRSIRLRLTKIFYARGCHIAEDLADETIDRVANKIDSLLDSYEGNPARYFYGVGKRVFLEYTRKPIETELPLNLKQYETNTEELERRDNCLTECLDSLRENQKAFILRYYTGDKQAKIDQHQRMTEELGLTASNLRVRAFRIRSTLQKCVLSCVNAD